MSTNAHRLGLHPCVCASIAALAVACLDRPVAPATPSVTARFGEVTSRSAVSKIDLLFMIDNSASMADKQAILAAAIPDLVNRLVDPICVAPDGSDSPLKPDAAGRCPAPTERDFKPINDIHIGIITSSIGGHGAPNVCDPTADNDDVHGADMSHLVARNGAAMLPTFRNLGFLNWNPKVPGAYADATKLTLDFRTMVTGVGQHGCGYEAQLESVYRFLVDPAPYKTITLSPENIAVPHDVDDVVLKERADFLRPDSLVAVVAVTDENDYSFVDGGIGWAAAAHIVDRPFFKSGASVCQTNPNDRCCVNCDAPDVVGCTPHTQDPACAAALTDQTDPENLRASRSKQQYGIDFAWPIERYIEGFTQPVLARFGNGAQNPLFRDLTCTDGVKCAPQRDPGLVFFAGIVGVPWQDIARDPADLSKGFQNSNDLATSGTWSIILGDPTASPPIAPSDPHMIVSRAPRAGIAGPESPFGADPKNGHEWAVPADPGKADLQYACTFPLHDAKDCSTATRDCDCHDGDTTKNPLCQNTSGAYGTLQFAAKGYPGLRELQLLKGLGAQGIIGSICPKNTSDETKADFGYRPAIATLIARLRQELSGRCLPRTLAAGTDGSVSCVILEVFDPPAGDVCRCEGTGSLPGRTTPAPEVLAAFPDLDRLGSCSCELLQLKGTDGTSCLNDTIPRPELNGWCYVDPGQSGQPSQCKLVQACASNKKRVIRYVGEPPRGSNVILCQEQSFMTGQSSRESLCK